MNNWLKLSGSVFLFAAGGVTHFQMGEAYNPQTQRKVDYTELRNQDGKIIGTVEESPDEILALLGGTVSQKSGAV